MLSGVLPVFQNLNYKLQRKRLSDVFSIQQSHEKLYNKLSRVALGGLHEDKFMRHFTSNGTDQCQNGSLTLLTPYQE